MSNKNQDHLEALKDIKQLMTKSSRFVGLSGLSGIAAGICALIAAWYTSTRIECWKHGDCQYDKLNYESDINLQFTLLKIGLVTFAVAFSLAFFFTYLRSKKTNVPVWGYTARKVLFHIAVPMVVGGLLIWRMMNLGFYSLMAPACLIFYGLALINAGKFTLSEVRYLGYGQLILGIINLWMVGYGLYFWAAGFGVLHIIYGILMWNRYERRNISE